MSYIIGMWSAVRVSPKVFIYRNILSVQTFYSTSVFGGDFKSFNVWLVRIRWYVSCCACL